VTGKTTEQVDIQLLNEVHVFRQMKKHLKHTVMTQPPYGHR
jgi:hypothetical protein